MQNKSLFAALSAGLRTKAAVGVSGFTGSTHHLGGFVREPFAGAWQRNLEVEGIGGLTSFGAVYACISRIANDIGKLEPTLLTAGLGGIPTEAGESPFWRVLRTPNTFQNRIQFFVYWLTCKLLYGNTYALKQREAARGIVTALYLLDPRRVTPMVTPDGAVYYSIGGDHLARTPSEGGVVPASEVIHDRGVTLWHPLVGVPPLYACGLSATQGLRIQANSAQFFTNMSRPSGMLTAPGTITEVTAIRLKEHWEKNYSGANIGRLAVLGDGLEYQAMTIPAEQAQLIQQLEWTAKDIAGCFAIPLHKIGVGQMPTSNNVEALELQYYTGCLQILIESIELCLKDGLEVGKGYSIEMNLEGLMRMDTGAQVEMLAKAVGGAIMAPNEARAKRRLAPVIGGASVYLQQQNFSLEALAKRDAQPDPFGTARAPTPTVATAPTVPPGPPAPDSAAEERAAEFRAMLDGLMVTVPGAISAAIAKAIPIPPAAAPECPPDDDAAEFAAALIARLEAIDG